ncbi:MAG: hypothetical protein V3V01_04895 [Acidimicrobiales bacterium]
MPDFFQSNAYPMGGGLNLADAPERIPADEATELTNVRFSGSNRWTSRRAGQLLYGQLNDVCGTHPFPHGAMDDGVTPVGIVYLDWDGAKVSLYKSNNGKTVEFVGILAGWGSVSERPKTITAVLREALFIVDEGKNHGLTIYDPEERFEEGVLFQPSFKFDRTLTTAAAPMFPRTIATYNNFLFVAGHGSEADPDRPEVVRFSYLGLEFDTEGAGDSAEDPLQPNPTFDPILPVSESNPEFLLATGGVRGMFDIEDFFFAGQRGTPVVGMKQGAERLVIATRFAAYILFGYDRTSFFLDLIDNQRGCVAGRAIGEADGVVYWMSPLGPSFWAGGRVQSLERKITPRLRDIDFDTCFFLHQREEYDARWYYSMDGGDPNRALEWNYLYEKWKELELGIRVFCGGSLRPGTALRAGPGGDPVPGPGDALAPPSNLFHQTITPHGATAVWTNNETGPEIVTEHEFKEASGVYQPVAEHPSGVERFTYVGLLPGTTYFTRVRHKSTASGAESIWVEAQFTTLTEGTLNTLGNFSARSVQLPTGRPFVWEPYIICSWTDENPQIDDAKELEFTDPVTGFVVLILSVPFPPQTSIAIPYRAYAALDPTKTILVRGRALFGSEFSPWTPNISVPPPPPIGPF